MLRGRRIANLGLGKATSLAYSVARIRSWRYGEIEVVSGKLNAIYPRWWPKMASEWEAIRDLVLRPLPTDVCRVYYSFPLRSPGFMAVLYAHSGPNTRFNTLRRGVSSVDEIAAIWDVQAIVCEATNKRLTERLLNRLGYVRHATSLGKNNYIKRLK